MAEFEEIIPTLANEHFMDIVTRLLPTRLDNLPPARHRAPNGLADRTGRSNRL